MRSFLILLRILAAMLRSVQACVPRLTPYSAGILCLFCCSGLSELFGYAMRKKGHSEQQSRNAVFCRQGEIAERELQSCIAAASALVNNVGQFLNPYLGELLSVLLQPQILSSPALQAPTAAVCAGLTSSVPTRLLLPALVSYLSTALQVLS